MGSVIVMDQGGIAVVPNSLEDWLDSTRMEKKGPTASPTVCVPMVARESVEWLPADRTHRSGIDDVERSRGRKGFGPRYHLAVRTDLGSGGLIARGTGAEDGPVFLRHRGRRRLLRALLFEKAPVERLLCPR